eukprot:gene3352-28127_t
MPDFWYDATYQRSTLSLSVTDADKGCGVTVACPATTTTSSTSTTSTTSTEAPITETAKIITIIQSGDWEWTMVSETAGVVGSSGMWPTLTIPPGSTVHFQGTVQSSHQFAVKDSANVVVVGPSALAAADGSSMVGILNVTYVPDGVCQLRGARRGAVSGCN